MALDYYFTLAAPAPTDPVSSPELFSAFVPEWITGFERRRAEFLAKRPVAPSFPFDGATPIFRSFREEWVNFWDGFLDHLGASGRGEDFADARAEAHAVATLYDDVRPALSALRGSGWVIGLLSDADHHYLHRSLVANGLVFDGVVCSQDISCYKPHRVAFEAICDQLGVAAHEAVYVGDSPRTDVEGARRAGLSAVWLERRNIAWPSDLEPPPATIASLMELPELLRHE